MPAGCRGVSVKSCCDHQRAVLKDKRSEAVGNLHVLQHGIKAAQSLIDLLLASTPYTLQEKNELFRRKSALFRSSTYVHT